MSVLKFMIRPWSPHQAELDKRAELVAEEGKARTARRMAEKISIKEQKETDLRDFFAGCALARGVGGKLPGSQWRSADIGVRCREAYEWADAMLKAKGE